MNDQGWFWFVAVGMVVVYCMAQAVRDYRAKHFGWAIAALVSAGLLLSMPFPTHSVTVDLPTD